MIKFTFDPRAQRYRYTTGDRRGQFVSEKNISRLVEDYIIQQRKDLYTITDILLADKINPNTWQYSVAKVLKEMHINSYSLGKGGIGRLTEADRAVISARLKSEFKFLQRFTQDIIDGKLSDAQIKNRLALYIDGAYSAWQTGKEQNAVEQGFKFEIWDVAGDDGTCSDCKGKARLGWQPVGVLGVPGVGVQCLSRCRCNKRFSNDPGTILGRRDGWLLAG